MSSQTVAQSANSDTTLNSQPKHDGQQEQTQSNAQINTESWQSTEPRVYTDKNDQQGVVGKLERDCEDEKKN
ncbi:hypothetical protein K7432_015194 [Basidiobolus ranarum]|uniref:Uncharacterized protein n=1 Tax=Basidiobolus ranarum TaxID=34480 RepID=A0ABR2VP06_9FUNG